MLPEKIAQLREGATKALTVAEWWDSQIATHGVEKATAFYKHIGLNHLESKSIEWDGLILSREPNEVEKLCVKGIAQAQESGKETIKGVLLKARSELIDSALTAIKKLQPATYHELILTMPEKLHSELRDQVDKVFMRGKDLVNRELGAQSGKSFAEMFVIYKQSDPTEDDDAELDDLTELTDARLANDVQSRITAAATRFALLGLTGAALWKAVRDELNAGSVSYIDRASTGLANKVLNFGRFREAQDRKDEIQRIEFSAILDQNVCDNCAPLDGETASDESDLEPVPVASCLGGDWCRCFHVYIAA